MSAPRVRYVTIPCNSIDTVYNLSAKDKVVFLDTVHTILEQLRNGEEPYIKETGKYFLDMAIRDLLPEMEKGYRNYLGKIDARKKGKEKEESTVNQRSISDISVIGIEQNIPEEKRSDKEQTRRDLIAEGFSEVEVNKAFSEVKSWAEVRNLTSYIRSIILRHRQGKPTAQDYGQRDYSDKEKMLLQRMIDMAKEDSSDNDGKYNVNAGRPDSSISSSGRHYGC